MTDYIEREAFLKNIEERYCTPCKAEGKNHGGCLCRACWVDDMCGEVIDAPASDVAPVVHSYWEGYPCSQYMGTDECGEPKWRDGRFYVCHNYKCRRKTVIKSNYCPNCGARMDTEDKNND